MARPVANRRSTTPPSRVRRLARRFRAQSPTVMLMLIYAGAIVAGSALLALPFARTVPMGVMDVLFTATSAVTVTGLVLYDTGLAFTVFGQMVIAILIQIGGLGLMTFAVLLFSALGMPVGMPEKHILRENLNQTSTANLMYLVRSILKIALTCEAVGVIVLCFVFIPDHGFWPGLWQSVFHVISAFNNAGFALYGDSLSRYVADPLINLTIPALFIIGGLGFVVIGDMLQKRAWGPLLVHTKLMLVGSLILILWGWATFAALEWSNPATLGAMTQTPDKIMAAWFQGVTPRTAGFNTLDTGGMHDATTLMTIALMLVGAGSTSTAGGIKVTTFIVLLLATIAFFRRRTELHVFGRSLGLEVLMKVLALTTVCILTIMITLFAISISHDGNFLDLAFEVVSAFGTVGLSRGATGELDTLGQMFIMAMMFLGRVGPLTLGFFLATRSRPRVRYPSGEVYLG